MCMQELAVAASMNRRTRRLVTWLFVVVVVLLLLLVCSCSVHVGFSSRPTADKDGGTRRVLAAAAGFATASRYRRIPSSKGNPSHTRRLLGTRTTTGRPPPPPPLPNKPKATVIASPPPPLQ